MKSSKRGKNISAVEVSHISRRGFWLLIAEKEYFVDFDTHPWFKDAAVGGILDVQLRHGHHLFWPRLDVDLELESLVEPGKYPLIYKF
jgi:hypothetical protein